MSALIIMIVAFVGYILMYNLYGKFIGQKIFKLSQANSAPAVAMEDGVDYVPTKKEVIFGHHFTSIASAKALTNLLLKNQFLFIHFASLRFWRSLRLQVVLQ